MINLLTHIYSEINWKNEWFFNLKTVTKGFWKNQDVQRDFFRNLASSLGIKSTTDWKLIKLATIYEHGGKCVIDQYGGSLMRALQTLFPETKWERNCFYRAHSVKKGHWLNPSNLRKFIDDLEKKFEIKNPRDWGKIKSERILENGGKTVLRYYGSVFKALSNIKKDVVWDKSWFINRRIPSSHWESPQNARQFLDEIALKYGIEEPADWKRVSTALINKQGGKGLLSKYNNSLFSVLKSVYQCDVNHLDSSSLIQRGMESKVKIIVASSKLK